MKRPARWLLLPLLPLALPALACSVNVGTVNLTLPARQGVAPAAPGRSVEILPVQDERPEVQREGDSPAIIPLLIYNQRRGDWYTGDENFDTVTVPEATTAAFAGAFRGSRFGEPRAREGSPAGGDATPGQRCDATGADYVAHGTIRDFYGYVKQKAYLAILPIPFVAFIGFSNAKSDPLGVMHLDVHVVECASRRTAYRRQLRSHRRYPEESMATAAKGALADTMEQLANETR